MRLRYCCTVSLLLLLITGALAYQLFRQERGTLSDDGRTGIAMSESERQLVLAEMRQFLATVSTVAGAIEEENVSLLAEAARRSGMAAGGGMPAALGGRLPIEFKRLGRDTHSRFDQMALDAEQMGDMRLSLQQLARLLDNCVICHAAYRIDSSAE